MSKTEEKKINAKEALGTFVVSLLLSLVLIAIFVGVHIYTLLYWEPKSMPICNNDDKILSYFLMWIPTFLGLALIIVGWEAIKEMVSATKNLLEVIKKHDEKGE